MRPHQGSVEGKENLPCPAGHTLLDAPQDPIVPAPRPAFDGHHAAAYGPSAHHQVLACWTFPKEFSQEPLYLLTIRKFGIVVSRWLSAETAAEVVMISPHAAAFKDTALLQTATWEESRLFGFGFAFWSWRNGKWLDSDYRSSTEKVSNLKPYLE